MAMNVLRAGFKLGVYDSSKEAMRKLEDAGATQMDLRNMVEECDDVVMCLPDGNVVKQVSSNFNKPDQLIIDMSTTHPDTSKEIALELAARDVSFMDAPVTGERARAEAGTLTVMQ